MAYSIRPYRDNDAEALATIIAAAIVEIGPHAYSPEQVAAWSARHPDADWYRKRMAAGDIIFVAAEGDDKPVAYALIEPDGHVDHLYNHPGHTRRGLAERLLATADSDARLRGIERLHTEASDLARPAFERAGYIVTGRRDFTIAHQGREIPIHNWAMENRLR